MKVIGITGGVGCGKSAVLEEIKNRYNCILLLADDAAKELELPGHECYDRIVELLGKDILDENGYIINKKMAEKIFTGDNLLSQVNDIIHPAVREFIISRINEERERGEYSFFFLEAALLIECGYKSVVDEMWYIYADENTRRDRLKAARGYSDSKIDSIMQSQLTEDEFRAGTDVVIDNSKDLDNTMMQIESLLGKA